MLLLLASAIVPQCRAQSIKKGAVYLVSNGAACSPETRYLQLVPRAMVVNTDKSTGRGVHWLACLDVAGKRFFNDPLGYYGKDQRADLETLQPHPFEEDDPEQQPQQKDCGVRALVALSIGLRCGVQFFLDL